MKKYKSKSVEIEVMIFTTNNEVGSPTMDAIVNWMNQGKSQMQAWHNGTNIFIKTTEGEEKADVGDYIVRNFKGDFYPCKPDVFIAAYENI